MAPVWPTLTRTMATSRDLQAQLERLDGQGYPAYKAIRGSWDMGDFRLSIDHVQGDPFAAPSRVSAHLPPASAGLDPWLLESRRWAAWLAHEFSLGVSGVRGSGSGKSGAVAMASPGQLALPQTAVQVGVDGTVEARFTVGLPARGRRILGRAASALLTSMRTPRRCGASSMPRPSWPSWRTAPSFRAEAVWMIDPCRRGPSRSSRPSPCA